MKSNPTSLAERWRSYTGDRDLELAIRSALRVKGYKGAGARILDARLIAVKRPGWVQIYTFLVEAEDDEQRPWTLYGVSRQDERYRSEVRIYTSESERDFDVVHWSRGLVTMHRRQRSVLEWVLIVGFVGALVLAVVSSLQS